jgi:hypothetical protein
MAPWPSSFFPATTSASTSTVGAVDLPLGSRVRAHPYPSRRPRTSRPKPNAKIVAYADALANYPNLVESSAATSPRPATTTKPNFPFGLDVILDGVDRFLAGPNLRHAICLLFVSPATQSCSRNRHSRARHRAPPARKSSSHACAVRLVNVPAAGRPRPLNAGPIFFWTWRPSGSRYFAYQTGPRPRSIRNTCPLMGSETRPVTKEYAILGTYPGHGLTIGGRTAHL